MKKLEFGISIYPEHSTTEQDNQYIEMAARLGYTRLFTCLLSVEKSREEILEEFGSMIRFAHEKGMKVSVDTVPKVIEKLGASPLNLKPLHDLGVDVLRLDMSYGILLDALMTRNPYGIEIEFNGSNDAGVKTILEQGGVKDQMRICHNFFPQVYTALDVQKYTDFNNKWEKLNLPIAAFVSSQKENTFGPWPVKQGLVTVEDHRFLPIEVQARHLVACQKVDVIFVGNAYATQEELIALASIDTNNLTLRINLEDNVSPKEQEIVYYYPHQGRNDCSDLMIRSSFIRFVLKDRSIPVRECKKEVFERGDVLIVNDRLSHYSGEIQIVCKPIKNLGHHNLVGKIHLEDRIIFDQLTENRTFKFIK